jgi:hypothetical protein
MRRDVRILLVGDGERIVPKITASAHMFWFTEGVGKSTIVTSLIKESFVAHVRILPIRPVCTT